MGGKRNPAQRQLATSSAIVLVALTVAGWPSAAQAQQAQDRPLQDAGQSLSVPSQTAQADEAAQADIVVTGSRFGPRVVTDSPTPIDAISSEELTKTGATDLQQKIKVVVPSFSTPRPVAAGTNDFLTPPTLRGLSTGQVLLLVNGKRRHTNAELNSNNQIGRGDVAYDFNAIPPAALSRVEVLRDGAAAQYGSDAIAGVISPAAETYIFIAAIYFSLCFGFGRFADSLERRRKVS